MERDHSPEIGLLAYHLWEASGCPAGQDLAFWLQAEKQLLGPHHLNGQTPPAGSTTPRQDTAPARASKPRHRPPPAARKAAGRRAAS